MARKKTAPRTPSPKKAPQSKAPRPPGAMRRAEAFFIANVGKVFDNQTLRSAIGGTADSWTRRVRELRDELGYNIQTATERSDLKPGQYVLVDLHRRPIVSRKISKKLRSQVLERNGYMCQACGVGAGEIHDNGRPARLHIGHVVDAYDEGKAELDNLRALCSLCNEGAANVSPPRANKNQLVALLRRTAPSDQRAALEWLKRKFRE